MAKAKRKSTTSAKGRKSTPKEKVASTSPAQAAKMLLGSGGKGDVDPRATVSVAGASSKEVNYGSRSEPLLESTAEKAEENAQLIGEAWKQRIATEGKEYWICPICPGTKSDHFKTKKRAADHIKKEHPMRVKELKMKKASKALYEPKSQLEAPKRTMADAVHPKYRPMVEAQIKQRELLKPISEHAKSLSVNGNSLMKLVALTESQAIQRLPTLNDKDLAAVAQLAQNRGKRLLARAARKLCSDRGVSAEVTTTDPSGKMMLIQEALRKANVNAQVYARRG